TVNNKATRSSRLRTASCSRSLRAWPRIGTKAWEKAPSANSRRSRLGIRKATQKASVNGPAPKARAIRMSRARPVMRESRVKLLTVAADLSRLILSGLHADSAIQTDGFTVDHFVFNDADS